MTRVYRLLLHLLPRDRRERYGEAMAGVLAEHVRDVRGRGGLAPVGWLLMKETGGLVKFSMRERWARARRAIGAGGSGRRNRGRFADETRWAWRGVRARRWRAGLVVGLMGAALGANTLVFAVSDSLVFHVVPYRDAHQLVEIQSTLGPSGRSDSFLSADLLEAWRKQADMFAAVHGYLTKSVFVLSNGLADITATADVTPGLIEMLGAQPVAGRLLTDADARETDVLPALVREDFARERFGGAVAAVGQRIETSAQPVLIVGVLPRDFSFPRSSIKIWRALDPRGPLTRNFVGVSSLARLTAGRSPESVNEVMKQRSRDVGAALGNPEYAAGVTRFERPGPAGLFFVLLGAAWCLLLTACGSVAGLELTGAVLRVRTFAVQLALGASRALLVRVAFLEGALLLAGSLVVAGVLTWLGVRALETYLPTRLTAFTLNPIDFDWRALLYMTGAGFFAWFLPVLPVVVFASRPRLMDVLKMEDRSVASSRVATRLRRLLTVAEVAIGVVLLVGGVLYARSYRAQLAIAMGFDSTNVASIGVSLPPQLSMARPALVDGILERVSHVPGVFAITDEWAPPFFGTPWSGVKLEVDDRPPVESGVSISVFPVAPAYFSVLHIPLQHGRMFAATEPSSNVIVTADFAESVWPQGDALGHRFRRRPTDPWMEVIGVTGHLRREREGMPGIAADSMLLAFSPRPPAALPRPLTPEQIKTAAAGGSYSIANFIVRLDDRRRQDDVLATARAVDSRFKVSLSFVDDDYARTFASTRLAAQVVGVFGVLAALIAGVGIYAVMMFLVAGRAREIGIRMALGASRRDVTALVLGSSARLVAVGAVLGLGTALALSRYVESQLFGIAATDPLTYAAVATTVVGVASLATWHPSRRAAAIDPAITLRAS